MLVITYANYKDQFLEEFEASLVNNQIDYKILGSGEKWTGWPQRTRSYREEINNIVNRSGPDAVVIVCDAFDLFFVAGTNEIMKKYKKLADGKILFGGELNCPFLCCFKEQDHCHGFNDYYLQAGFMMGPAGKILKGLDFVMNIKETDDQRAWGYYKYLNCEEIVIDYNSEIVLNYDRFEVPNIVFKNHRVYNIRSGVEPCVVHIPNQNEYRSEKMRDFFFPGRKKFNDKFYKDKHSVNNKFNNLHLYLRNNKTIGETTSMVIPPDSYGKIPVSCNIM